MPRPKKEPEETEKPAIQPEIPALRRARVTHKAGGAIFVGTGSTAQRRKSDGVECEMTEEEFTHYSKLGFCEAVK